MLGWGRRRALFQPYETSALLIWFPVKDHRDPNGAERGRQTAQDIAECAAVLRPAFVFGHVTADFRRLHRHAPCGPSSMYQLLQRCQQLTGGALPRAVLLSEIAHDRPDRQGFQGEIVGGLPHALVGVQKILVRPATGLGGGTGPDGKIGHTRFLGQLHRGKGS